MEQFLNLKHKTERLNDANMRYRSTFLLADRCGRQIKNIISNYAAEGTLILNHKIFQIKMYMSVNESPPPFIYSNAVKFHCVEYKTQA